VSGLEHNEVNKRLKIAWVSVFVFVAFSLVVGLLYRKHELPNWKRFRQEANSKVLLRFPDPRSKGYRNTAWVASDFEYEVQIDKLGAPDGSDKYRTGAIYNEYIQRSPDDPPGRWASRTTTRSACKATASP
jgi:hypothetical protein